MKSSTQVSSFPEQLGVGGNYAIPAVTNPRSQLAENDAGCMARDVLLPPASPSSGGGEVLRATAPWNPSPGTARSRPGREVQAGGKRGGE